MPPVADAEAIMRAVLTPLRAHPASDEALMSAACALMANLAPLTPQLAVTAAKAGIMEAIVQAMRGSTHESNISNVFTTNACKALSNLVAAAPAYRQRALGADAIATVAAVATIYPEDAVVQQAASAAFFHLCEDDADACAQAARCGAVKLLCDAIRTHAHVLNMLQFALRALSTVTSNHLAAAETAAAGPAGIGLVAQVLLSSTPQQDGVVLLQACMVLAQVAICGSATASSEHLVLPLLHVLDVCLLVGPVIAVVCQSLLAVVQSSPAHAAKAARHGAAAAVDAVARAYPADAVLRRSVMGIRAVLARVESTETAASACSGVHSAAAAAKELEEAERRAAAMADAFIAEEEAARVAPQAAAARKRNKKKRSSGGNAAEGAATADDDATRPADPEIGAAAGAAAAELSTLALDDAAPSAAAVRRRRRAATKAARRLAQRAGAAGGSQPTGSDGAETEEDEAAEAVQPAAAPPLPPPPAAAVPAPPPPPPPPPLKECCVCLLDMPAAEQMVLGPCGHRCMCEECWRTQLLPREPAARLCPICDAPVAMAMRLVANVFDA